uniref:Uncharacterized protein n=1 Tax=viral metagenome TaxID=1070528 RepID=A0A6C0M2N0_9ZZZZ
MSLLKIFFILDESEERRDEILTVTPMEGNYYGRETDVFVMSYKSGRNSHYTFYFNRQQAMSYLETMLFGLSYDVEPISKIQVMSSIFPSVLYKVRGRGASNELVDRDVRDSILELVFKTLTASPILHCKTETRPEYDEDE